MNERTRKRRDFIQNITIALLSVSAVLLFTQTQIYNLGASAGSGYLRLLSGTNGVSAAAVTQQDTPLPAPVRVAVTGPYGRYGSVTLTTAEESFEPFRALLEQALGSARTYTACDEQTFLNALGSSSVYYDFLSPLPLSVLADLVWTSDEDSAYARHLVVAEQSSGVSLFLWDGDARYLRCDTALSSEDLLEAVNQYELGNAQFAMDIEGISPQTAAPCTLFLEEAPALPVLSSSVGLSDTDLLLTALRFNPNTQQRYPDSNSGEVIVESGRTLRIGADGTVSYDGDSTLSIETAGTTPTLLEAATGTGTLLNTLFSATAGDAAIYLEDVRQNDETTTLRFGYQVHGVPIRFSDGQSAAEVTLSGSTVSSMMLRIRQYTATETDSLLLPLRQALAIAAGQPGDELSIGYADSGTGTVSAQWLSD